MNKVTIYSKSYCPYCKAAKATLDQMGIKYHDIDVTHDAALAQEMQQRSQRRTVPQIFINNRHLGGNDDLQKSLKNGEFIRLIKLNHQAA